MSLKEYEEKRDFKKSHEPLPIEGKKSRELRFCVQKHYARRLHYDFRLEYKGVLLSWAVPKGPSLDPKDKRLAMKVEDHPLDYQYFEGEIPKGNYGAGKVEIWDAGTYYVPGYETIADQEKRLTEGLKKGHFSIFMQGNKLNGIFTLQKLKKDAEDNSWLLIKKEITPIGMPESISPMLATLVDKPFDGDEWLFEPKWDGFRALAFIDQKNVQLKSRSNRILNKDFSPIVEDLEKCKNQVILDGELVVLDDTGRSDFQLMQNFQREGKGFLYYYVFDLLFKDGQDLRNLSLEERKKLLQTFLQTHSFTFVRFSDHIIKEGKRLFKEASKKHLEGIVGKKIKSTYQSKRSQDWVKIKTSLRQDLVIGGFTAPKGSRKKFGSLLVGFYDEKGALIYAGHVGGGFDQTLLREIYAKLEPLIQINNPFKDHPKGNSSVTWVKPELICEVSFSEWTKDNRLRQPIFHGLRTDISPLNVRKEIPKSMDKIKPSKKLTDLALTNLDKIYWKDEGYTKGDLIDYYTLIAPVILPYLKGRPITMHRYPEGVEGKEFYQKNMKFTPPNWMKMYPVQQESKIIQYLGIHDLKSLLYVINLGSIDLHPFMSRYEKLRNPDYCVIDLDPHDIQFEKVIEAALKAHEILEDIQFKHFCKTSGSKGLHILIPLKGRFDFEQSKQFAEILCHCIHKQLPHTTSLERNPQKRPKKIYLDFLQNRFAQTIVAPYSVRPRPGATVSTPLLWSEVNESLDPKIFNIQTIPIRIKEKGDLFKGILGPGVDIKKALMRLEKKGWA